MDIPQYQTAPPQTGGNFDAQSQTKRLAEEMNAMEAVRELLFGKRLSELQVRLDSIDEYFRAALFRLESNTQQRFAELEKTLNQAEVRLSQLISSEELSRQHDLNGLQKATEQRFAQTEKYVETLAQETGRQQQAIRGELRKMHQDFAAETHQIRQTTPTIHGLADLFQQSSERLKSSLLGTPAAPTPIATTRAKPLEGPRESAMSVAALEEGLAS